MKHFSIPEEGKLEFKLVNMQYFNIPGEFNFGEVQTGQ